MARSQDSANENSRPDINEFVEVLKSPIDIRSIALTSIFLLSALYSLYFARDFLLPVVLAFVLSFLLAPPVRVLTRVHIPVALGAAMIMAGLLGLCAYSTYRLSEPAQKWLQKAPTSFATIRGKFRALIEPVEKARRSLALNPVVIFIWLIFWGWVWGVAGAVLAVPLLAILKIICDHFKPLAAFSEFLGKETKTASP